MQSAHVATLADSVALNEHLLGPDRAPITLVEYGDFECPSCKLAAPAVRLLLQRFPSRVRLAFRHFPLEKAHPHALLAAEAAEAAAAQGKFWEMHDQLFEHQLHLKPTDLRRYAMQLGMDMTRYVAEVDDHIYLQKVREDIESGKRSMIRATPTFFINGMVQDVSFGMQALHDAVAVQIATLEK